MTERVTLRVDDWRKEEWRKAVEQNETYDSVTQLVKLSVTKELNGNGGPSADGGGTGYIPDVTNGEILQRLKEIDKSVEETKAVAEETKTEVTQPDEALEKAVMEAIPSGENYAETIASIADRTDYPEHRVDSMLRQLAYRTTIVKKGHRESHPGDKESVVETVFWKEV